MLLPFFKVITPNWIKLGLFLCDGGRSVWSTDTTDTMGLLEENGFPVLQIITVGETVYAEIDPKTLRMDNFYQWSDINPTTSDCDSWRTLHIPVALWSCPVFKEHFWSQAKLPQGLSDQLSQSGIV